LVRVLSDTWFIEFAGIEAPAPESGPSFNVSAKRRIRVDEQDHQIDLATALGEDVVPDLNNARMKA
jgi:hypothetical protein